MGRDKIYAVITDNVIGSVHAFTSDGKSWADKKLALPDAGAAMVRAVAESTQTPADLAGVVYLGALATCCGGRALYSGRLARLMSAPVLT